MLARGITAVRLLVVLTFLVGMPVLALPQSIDWVAEHLYPAPIAKVRLASPAPPFEVATVAHEVPVESLESGAATSLESLGLAHPFENAAIATPVEIANPAPIITPERRRELMIACEAELQQLGATFYRLEAVDDEGSAYRFIAQFEESGGLPERFQRMTTHADPLVAMQEMVAQVRSRVSVARP